MHFALYRTEPRRGEKSAADYPLGYIKADSQLNASEIADTMAFRLRGGEVLIFVELKRDDQIRQAKAVGRERDRSIVDCCEVLERIKFSVD